MVELSKLYIRNNAIWNGNDIKEINFHVKFNVKNNFFCGIRGP